MLPPSTVTRVRLPLFAEGAPSTGTNIRLPLPRAGVVNSRLKLGQFQKVPPIERQVFNLVSTDHAAHLMLVIAEQWSCIIHRDLFAHVPDLKCEVDSSGCPSLNGGGAFQQTKSCCFRRNLVNAWGQRRRAVVAFLGGGEISRQPAIAIDNTNSCSDHRCGGSIRHDASEGPSRRLRVGRQAHKSHNANVTNAIALLAIIGLIRKKDD